jgi:hypothetical protein
MQPPLPFFRAFDTLRVDNARRRTGLPPDCRSAFDVQIMMDTVQRPVIVLKVRVFIQRAAITGRSDMTC